MHAEIDHPFTGLPEMATRLVKTGNRESWNTGIPVTEHIALKLSVSLVELALN